MTILDERPTTEQGGSGSGGGVHVMDIVPPMREPAQIAWTDGDDESVALAAAEFALLTRKPSAGGQGMLAYADGPDGAEQIREFDSTAARIILTSALQGG